MFFLEFLAVERLERTKLEEEAIEKNHFVREPLVLMLTLAKIKDAKCEYNVFFYYFLRL